MEGRHVFVNAHATRCASCGQPFKLRPHYIECWKGSDGRFYCSEFCAAEFEQEHERKTKH